MTDITQAAERLTFDETVKRHKAVEWLMMNDATFRVLMDSARLSPFNTVAVLDWSQWIRERVDDVSSRMIVTQQERDEGYPLPNDDAERMRRAHVRMGAYISQDAHP